MARIVVLGGTGYTGGNVAREAAARGHQVTAYARHLPAQPVDGVQYVAVDVLADRSALLDAVTRADVVVETLAPRGPLAGELRGLVAELAGLAAEHGTRLGVVGGAGSLLVAEGGPRLLDTPQFPDSFKPEALELTDVLADLRASDERLDWFFASPAGGYGAYAPGEPVGAYRVGGELLLSDDEGRSFISGVDFALALVDEIERPAHRRARFTVAY